MRRMFEFVCEDGHISEALVDETVRELACRACGKHSTRIVSSVRCNLEGITGAFPGAYDAWESTCDAFQVTHRCFSGCL